MLRCTTYPKLRTGSGHSRRRALVPLSELKRSWRQDCMTSGALADQVRCRKMRRRIPGSYSITSSARVSNAGGIAVSISNNAMVRVRLHASRWEPSFRACRD
jgi:hypothetical protein